MLIPYLVSATMMLCQGAVSEPTCHQQMFQCVADKNDSGTDFEYLPEIWQDFYLEICVESLPIEWL